MEHQIITIVVNSDIDPATLLDIAIEAGQSIADEIESYGAEAEFLEEETSVEPYTAGEEEVANDR